MPLFPLYEENDAAEGSDQEKPDLADDEVCNGDEARGDSAKGSGRRCRKKSEDLGGQIHIVGLIARGWRRLDRLGRLSRALRRGNVLRVYLVHALVVGTVSRRIFCFAHETMVASTARLMTQS